MGMLGDLPHKKAKRPTARGTKTKSLLRLKVPSKVDQKIEIASDTVASSLLPTKNRILPERKRRASEPSSSPRRCLALKFDSPSLPCYFPDSKKSTEIKSQDIERNSGQLEEQNNTEPDASDELDLFQVSVEECELLELRHETELRRSSDSSDPDFLNCEPDLLTQFPEVDIKEISVDDVDFGCAEEAAVKELINKDCDDANDSGV